MEQQTNQVAKSIFWLVFSLTIWTWVWHSWIDSWAVAFLCALGTYLLFFVFGVASFIKKIAIDAMPTNVQLVAARAEEFPQIDSEKLRTLTEQFVALGFAPLADYKLAGDKVIPAFGRVLSHPQHRCFAEIGQVFPPNLPPTPVGCVVVSSFEGEYEKQLMEMPVQSLQPAIVAANSPIPDPATRNGSAPNDDEDWSLSTTDREPDIFLWMLRHPRKLLTRHDAAVPAELVRIHLEHRRRMQDTLNLKVGSCMTFDCFRSRVMMSMQRMRRIMERKNALKFFYEWKFVRPQAEWWGEYSTQRKKTAQT